MVSSRINHNSRHLQFNLKQSRDLYGLWDRTEPRVHKIICA
jgi:hypothetical protein